MADLDLNDQLIADGSIRLRPVPVDADQYREKPDGHTDRVLERDLLAALVHGAAQPDDVKLTPDDFSSAVHVELARVVSAVAADGECNVHAVATAIESTAGHRRGALLGLLREVAALPPVVAPRAAMQRIADLAAGRRLQSTLARAHDAAARGDFEQARALAYSVGEAAPRESVVESIGDSVGRIIRDMVAGRQKGLLQLGLSMVDSHVAGLPPGSMTVIGASTGVGKTGLSLSIGNRLAKLGVCVGIVSCEDPPDVLASRVLAYESGVPGNAIRAGILTTSTASDVMGACERIRGLDFFGAYEPGATDASVMASMTVLVRKHKAKLVIVDYAQTIELEGANANAERRHTVSRVAARLKAHAARLGVPLVLNSQLARPMAGAEFKRPSKHSLKESGDLENMADLVLLLWRESNADDAMVRGVVAKSKWGGGEVEWKMKRRAGLLDEADC